ncbi:MAG: M20/M25/M40 family metallo-hydrolase [Kiritimatiellae bacterium]|nr:M20/M25/M40 family metallo-hydrolase [Kiritimatiellia bacterium]
MIEDSVRAEYFELLAFESVGADRSKLRETLACAMWLKAWLEKLGFSVALKSDSFSPPVIVAERKGEGKTVLFYGHYDVQPAERPEEWKTPPFVPTVVGDRVYCRGAQDDKGQFFAFFCGMRDFLESCASAPTIKIVLDGEEESGSGALLRMAESLRRELSADAMLVCDTSAAANLRPAIVAGLRGVAHLTLRLKGASRDLHSGEFGGAAPNPAQGMCELLASLHHADGSIAVAGFRDGIVPPVREELSAAEISTPGEEEMAAEIGCDPVGGQMGKSLAQRIGFEPTIEVNGVHSGYGGPGAKTVIPSEAVAKLSLRLVPGQKPKAAMDALRRHLEDRVPRGMKLVFEDVNEGAAGFRLPIGSPAFRLAADVLEEMDPRGALYMWDGASIPVLSTLRDITGAAPVIVGWGQAENRIHSPDESYSFEQFAKAREWAAKILAAL